MRQYRHAVLRQMGGIAAALALIASSAALLAAPAGADPAAGPITRYVATTGSDTLSSGAPNDCTDQADPCASIWQAANFDVENAVDTLSAYPDLTVEVAPGTYDNNPYRNVWLCQSVRIEGAVDFAHTGAGPTIVEADPGNPTVQVPGFECPAAGAGLGAPVASLTNLEIVGDGSAAGILTGFGAQLTISASTVTGGAPGIWAEYGADLALQTSTIARNAEQGLLVTAGSAASVTDSTIAGTAGGDSDWPNGGLVYDAVMPELRMTPKDRVTPKDEASSGGVSVTGSIVAAQGTGVPDCAGTVIDGGYNLSSDAGNSCGLTAKAHSLAQTGPDLAPLGDYGGPTRTMKPLAGSPAIDAIPSSSGTCDEEYSTDQRGLARPQPAGGACDIGAVEVEQSVAQPAPPACPALVIDTTSLPDGTVGQPYSQPLAAHGGCDSAYTWALVPPASDTTGANQTESAAVRHLTRRVARALAAAPVAGLPAGVSLSAAGVLSGTPTQAGDFTFTVSVDDPVLATLTLHVNAAPTPSPSSPAPTTSTPAPSPSSSVAGVSAHRHTPAASPSAAPLAATGTPLGGTLALAAVLLGAGAALLLAVRTRRRAAHRH